MKSSTASKTSTAKIAGLMAIVLALFAAGLFLITRDDAPASKLLRQGNDAFAQENFLDAQGAYELAQNRQPELAEPFYNAANALYRQGSFADAVAQIQQALLNVEDEDLAQNSFYNMGNAAYNGQDLESAIQSYIDALLLNPNDADAKYNLELALQQKQQQEQEQQQQENQDQEQSEDSESQDGEQNQDQQDPNSENGDQPQDSQDGQGDQPSDQPEDGQSEQSDQNQEQQDPQQNGEGEPNEQEPDQQNPGNGQPQEGDPSDPAQNGMVPQPGERMTEQQARQLLMSIAQGSGTLQERLQQIYMSNMPPSAQDW